MNKIKTFFMRHIGVLILVILLAVFPTALTSQAKLSLRIIVTGLAIDKTENEYEVTAQVVKNSPGTESPGTSATIEFISDKAETISLALSNLAYKAGKAAAFSHVNFIVIGEGIVEDEDINCLDYFVRDKLIRQSTMVLVADGKASDQIKKTKDIELSVGLGLQKVFLYKQHEADGVMQTVLDFLKQNNTYSKTSVISTLSLKSESEEEESSSSSSESGGSQSGEQQEEGQSGSSGSSSDSSSQSSGSVYFEAKSPLMCFVDSKFVCKFEDDDFLGFMLGNPNVVTSDISVSGFENDILQGSTISINIKKKDLGKSIHYENEVPCLDMTIYINNAEISEILNSEIVPEISDDIYKEIEEKTSEKIKELVGGCFETAKNAGADVFGAYEFAYKFEYKKTSSLFKSTEDFVKSMRLNVGVVINKLDY